MKVFTGVAAAPGLAKGKVKVFKTETINIPRYAINHPDEEVTRLNNAISIAFEDTIKLKEKVLANGAIPEAKIFEAQQLIIEDPSLLDIASENIHQNINAEAGWMDAIAEYAKKLESLQDVTLRERAIDVRDVGNRVLNHLVGSEISLSLELTEPSIVVASELSPSQTASFKKEFVLAICTSLGGPTSHCAILAKALGIPAVVGLGNELLQLKDDDFVWVDGGLGQVTLNPNETFLDEFAKKISSSTVTQSLEVGKCSDCARTLDGKIVEVVSNVGGADDAQLSLKCGAEGVGLFRTEFLFLNRNTEPNEEEQYLAYKKVLDVMENRPVVIRTLDVGGDKQIPYINIEHEDNPFLGYRAIRLCLNNPVFYKKQLRALLRASLNHNLRIMLPMITTLDEIRRAKSILEESKTELIAEGFQIATQIQIGIMVETPAAVVMADVFAKEVDFFSIGTNDLTQYTMAAERTNNKVAYLGDPCSPAIIRQISRVIKEAHKKSIWVGLCGELAGDEVGIPLLLGLGLDEFSMSPKLIPHAKSVIRKWSMKEAKLVAEEALKLSSAIEVRQFVKSTR